MEMGERIKQRRTELKMSQDVLCKFVGVSRVSITGWENGNAVPKAPYLIGLAKGLQVTVDWLLTGKDLPIAPQLHREGEIDLNVFIEVYKLFEDAVMVAGTPYTPEVRAKCLYEMYIAGTNGTSPAAAMLIFLTAR